jgi:hypothetical protein
MAETIVLNGVAYAAKDVEVTWYGRIIRGVTELNYSEDTETEKVFVLGSKRPVWRTEGKEDAKGDIMLLNNEVLGIELAAKASITEVGQDDMVVIFKSLPVPMKQVLKGVKAISKAQGITAGSAAALGYKCNLDIMQILPLQRL